MPSQLPRAVRRSARDPSFSIYLLTVVLCLLRSSDLLSVRLAVAGTEASIGPTDLALLVVAVLAARRLRARGHVPATGLLAVSGAFAALILLTALTNDAGAVTAAGKLVELAALTVGTVAFVVTRERLATLLTVVVAYTSVAVAWAAIEFVGAEGGRQGSFVGEHDLAGLGTLALAVGLGRLHTHASNPGALAIAGLAAGVLGVVLGASLASLLGVYLAAAVITAISIRRHEVRTSAIFLTIAVAAVATAGTLAMRQGDLGFLQSAFGPPPERPGEYSASWSQRLIYSYVGGRVFLDRPLLGTGWEGELPPADFAEYVPDARERFPDEPAHYFPPTDRDFIPQQTYDQVLFQLGLVGAGLFAALALLTVRRAANRARQASGDAAYVPGGWLAATAAALAGAALFGGSPLTAVFWLTLGVVAAEPEGAAIA